MILPIKRKWYDLILSGEKKEEYRERKPYYTTRFAKVFPAGQWDKPKTIFFRNGYSTKSPEFMAECTLSVGEGKPEWGAEPGTRYYVLSIKEVHKRPWD